MGLLYPFDRASMSLLILFLLSALTFQSQAQSGSVTTTQSFSYTGQIVTYTVPTGVTSLTIEARGAEGGDVVNRRATAGKGAILAASVIVTPGQSLSILVGQQFSGKSAGGGGSFVVGPGSPGNPTPLVIAGGGGGASKSSNDSEAKHGQVNPDGGAGAGEGGTGGSGGSGSSGTAGDGGGGGLLGNGGGSEDFVNAGGQSFTSGGAGGFGNSRGSFGGGGAGGKSDGGGGGGYSGGGGGRNGVAGGGGSFTAGTRLFAHTGATDGNSGNGLVLITYTTPTQTIRYVKAGGSGTGDGTSWANASGDLQSQINIAGAEQVWVAAGTYKPGSASNTDRTISFVMKNRVAIYGGFAPTGNPGSLSERNLSLFVTTLSGDIGTPDTNGDNTYNVIRNAAGLDNTAVLDGFTISGGNASENAYPNGGGMFNTNSSPTLTNCSFQNNSSRDVGGGLFNNSSSPTLTNCSFSQNWSNRGGGIYNGRGSSPTITSCLFSQNAAGSGAGICSETNSSFRLVNCRFSQNTAGFGGALYNRSSISMVAINCSFDQNAATTSGGGGLYNSTNSTARLTNCSFSQNTAVVGGAVRNLLSATAILTNCIVWDNGGQNAIVNAPNGANETNSTTADYSLIEQDETDYTGSNNLIATTSPFASATNLQLTACSIAIDAGSNAAYTGPATDLAGNSRLVRQIDMGAYEFQGTPNSPVAITQQPVSGSSVQAGASVSVPVSVSGSVNGHQWYKDNLSSPVTGQNSATLTLTNVQTSDAGSYSLVVTGTCNSVTSTAFSLSVSAPAQPIRYVKAGGSGTGDGTSWANASGDLQSQINIAGAEQVWVAAGTYKPGSASNTDRTISFVMKESVAIYGGFVGNETSLSARPAVNPTAGSPSSSTLSGDIGTIGDNTDNSRQVVSSDGLTASARLDGFVISGAYNPDGTGSSRLGGGMYNRNSSPTLSNLRFSQNQAQFGGGIFNEVSNPSLSNCDFSQNQSSVQGGGIYNDRSSPAITSVRFSQNTTGGGGGVYNEQSNSTLINCTFIGNSGTKFGGGMVNVSSTPSLINCTFTANQSASGAALLQSRTSQLRLTNAILWDNQGQNAIVNQDNSSVTANYCLIEQGETDFTGSNNLIATTSPFVSATNLQLTACSIAIDAGSNAAYTGPATDLAGNPRLVRQIDLGAYEFQGTPNSPVAITQQPVSGSSVCVGSTVTAMVTVSGTSPAYQWYKDGQPVSGQTSATLTLTNVQTGDAGSYSVVVTGSCPGSLTSTAFSLTVNAPPAAPTLTSVGRTVMQSNAPLPLGQFVLATGSNTLSFSGINGMLAPPNADVSQAGVLSFSVTQTPANGCTSGVTVFTITVQPASPNSQTVCRSSTVVLRATTTGSRYEWYRNGQTIANRLSEVDNVYRGTKTASLTVVNIQAPGTFYCKVFAANGSFVWDGPYAVLVDFGCPASGARQAAAEVAEVPLTLTLTPNPITDGQLRAVVSGAAGQALSVQLLDLRGQVVQQQQWQSAESRQVVEWTISRSPVGVYLLRAQTPGQRTVIKVINQ